MIRVVSVQIDFGRGAVVQIEPVLYDQGHVSAEYIPEPYLEALRDWLGVPARQPWWKRWLGWT